MRLDGQHTLPASPERVWELLLDAEALSSCVPGVHELTRVGPDEYEGTMSLGVALVKGEYSGTIRITDKVPIKSYGVEVEGSGDMGTISAAGRIELSATDDKTLVQYGGEYQVAGALAAVPDRFVQPVARMLTNQFFSCVAEKLL